MRLHHVQVSIPAGGENTARLFYADGLGMTEVAKPAALAGRGGCWFRAFERETVTAEIHVGVDPGFVPAAKAHPALVVQSVDTLEELGARLNTLGFTVSWADRDTFDGYVRFHCYDGFGNRVEVLTPAV